MRAIKHKIKIYRRKFSPVSAKVLTYREFWGAAILLLSIILSTSVHVYTATVTHHQNYSHLIPVLFAAELALGFAFLSLRIRIDKEHISRHIGRPYKSTFRAALYLEHKAKREEIKKLFGVGDNYQIFAKELIESWEWRAHIKHLAGEAPGSLALKHFSRPDASRLATYIAGILAIIAGLVITLTDRDLFYSSIPSITNDSMEITKLLMLGVAFPISVSIYPIATIWSTGRIILLKFLEWIDDDYLSRYSFYSFIRDIIDNDDRNEKRHLKKTTGRAYWMIVFLTSPVEKIHHQWRRMKRNSTIAKRRSVDNAATFNKEHHTAFNSALSISKERV